MKKSFALNRFCLALALTTFPFSAHAEYSQVIIFGDSLSDTGRIKATVGEVAPAFAEQLQPSFTTNPDPVWASVLAESYGKTAKPFTKADLTGTNFAVGGARSGEEVNWNGVITVPSTATQIQEHLATTNGKANPNALYAVWIGSNDLIAAANAKTTEEARKAIANSVARTAKDITTLNQAGASVILVPNVPDLSLTPRAIYGESIQTGIQAKAQLAATLYNQGLYTTLNGMNANVVPANTFALLQEAVANKEAFGFKNTSGVACQMPPRTTGADDPASTSLGCTSAHLVEPNAGETYAFADDIHPSGKTHRILAQYYQNIINTPNQIGKLPQALSNITTVNDRHTYRAIDGLGGSHGIWANVHSNGKHSLTQMGVDFAGENSHTGTYLSHQKQKHTLSNLLNADADGVGAGIYHRHDFGKLLLKVMAGVDRLDVNTHRTIAWDGNNRSHTAQSTAKRLHGGVQLGYQMNVGKLQICPTIGVHSQQLNLNSLRENNPTLSTAMQFDTQTHKSLQGDVGVDVHYPISAKMTVLGGISHTHEFKDNANSVNASLTSIREYSKGFTTQIGGDKTHITLAHAGIQSTIGKANVNASVYTTHQNSDSDVGGSVGLQFQF